MDLGAGRQAGGVQGARGTSTRGVDGLALCGMWVHLVWFLCRLGHVFMHMCDACVRGLYATQLVGELVVSLLHSCRCSVCRVIHTVLLSLQHLACNQRLLLAAGAAFYGLSGPRTGLSRA